MVHVCPNRPAYLHVARIIFDFYWLDTLPFRSNLLESDRWNPSNGLSSIAYFVIQLVHLLQSEALGFVNHEVHECNANEAAASPDKEDFRLEIRITWSIIHEIWRGVRDSPVQEPVRCCGN